VTAWAPCRLVRIFSETGEQFLSMLELVDMYSALSRRAPFKWKCSVCFCMFDYDEDGPPPPPTPPLRSPTPWPSTLRPSALRPSL
jgi:hypothetical protein